RQIIDRLGPETVLHVIDPLPDFDPAEHEAEFAGQYVFHRDLSLNVLGDLPPMDAALVDGDHNWYTVYNELRLLREVARANDAPLPVLILHDVGWPYGRRDLYYDPTNIPDEFRREWSRKGMEPGKVWVVPYGAGLNPTLANANTEGGRRNGVRTGMDDFVAEHDQPLRVLVLPIYFGLAIVVEESRLAANPALREALDRLESTEGKDALLQVAEDIRIDHLIFQHKVYYDREAAVGRVARRYLGQVRANPVLAGTSPDHLDALEADLDALRAEYVRGDVVSVGAGVDGEALFLGAYVEAHDQRGRRLRAYDTSADPATPTRFAEALAALDVDEGRGEVVAVPADGTFDPAELPEHIALLRLGPDLPTASLALVDELRRRLSHGAVVVDGEGDRHRVEEAR
ncbi:MAG: hypothetical protein KF703_13675, partial [Actinobacteria bacterium]|nr:hypothetical protein [Actinomycetota bacterium]